MKINENICVFLLNYMLLYILNINVTRYDGGCGAAKRFECED